MANRYWVGGTASWDATAGTKWALTSGGAGGQAVPTSSDDVFFDAASGAVTCTVAASSSCLSLNFTGFTGTFAGSSALNIYGSLTLGASMTLTYTGVSQSGMVFQATGTGKTITTNGKSLTCCLSFVGIGGGWTLQDNVTFSILSSYSTGGMSLTGGTLDLNGKTVSASRFTSTGANTRVLTMGASTVNIGTSFMSGTGGWSISGSNITLNADTSTIRILSTAGETMSGGSLTYNNIEVTAMLGNMNIGTAITCNNFTMTGVAGDALANLRIGTGALTITGTLTLTGNSRTERIRVESTNEGTARTITAAAVSLTNVDFIDITGAGAATWSGTSIGNGGGNSNITFTTPVTRYWVGNGGNWQDTAHWSATSGGAGGSSVPICQDTVIFDANSFSSGGQTITMSSVSDLGKDVTFYGGGYLPTYAFGTGEYFVFGNLTFAPDATYNVNSTTIQMEGRENSYLTTNGAAFTVTTSDLVFWISKGGTSAGPISSVLLGSDFYGRDCSSFEIVSGGFNLNDFQAEIGSVGIYANNTHAPKLILGSGTLILSEDDLTSYGTRTFDFENFASVPTTMLDAGTGTIAFRPVRSNYTSGIYLYSDQDITIAFNKIYYEGPSQTSSNGMWYEVDSSHVTSSVNEFIVNGTNVPQRIRIDEPVTPIPTIKTFRMYGRPDNYSILSSTSAGVDAELSITNAEIYYTTIQDINSTTPITVYNCTNVSGNTNVTFATADRVLTLKTPTAFFEQVAFDTTNSAISKNTASWTNQTKS